LSCQEHERGHDGGTAHQRNDDEERDGAELPRLSKALGRFAEFGARAGDSSTITTGVMSSRIGPALEILADVLRNPTFKDEEIDRLRRQYLNSLRVSLGTPGTIARFVAASRGLSRRALRPSAFGHAGIAAGIKRDDIREDYTTSFTGPTMPC